MRLDRGRYGQIEVMMAYLLEAGVLTRGDEWGAPESRMFAQNKHYRLAVRSAPPADAHELERRFVAAIERAPDKNALQIASDVTDGESCDQIEARLISAGLLYDESRRWRISWLGWALFWIGLCWAIGRLIASGAPIDGITNVVFIVSMSTFLSNVMSMPETASGPDSTPNGRLVVERARERHASLGVPLALPDVRLAVALFGEDIVASPGSANPGVRDTYELLAAEAERYIGL